MRTKACPIQGDNQTNQIWFSSKEEDEFSEVAEVPPREEMVLKLKMVDENQTNASPATNIPKNYL